MLEHRWRYAILCVGFLLVFVSYGIRFGYGILLPPMKYSLSLSDMQSGVIASSYFVAYTASAPVVGVLADRVSGRKLIPLLTVFMGLGTFMMGFVTDWVFAALLFALVGFGSHAGWIGVIRLITIWFEAKKRGRAIGIVNSGYGVGYGFLGLLLPVIVREYGWSWGWYLMGAFAIVLAVASAFLLKEKAPYPPQYVAKQSAIQKKFFFTVDFWFIAFSYLAIAFATSIIMTFMVAYFSLDLSVEYAVSAALVSVVAFSGIPGSLIFPTLSDRIGRKKGLFLCNLSVAASVFGMVVVGANVLLLSCLAVAYGAFYSAMFPIYAACASEYFGAESSSSVLGLWTLFYGVGAALSPTVAGYLSELIGSYSPAFTLSAAVMILSVILLLPISSTPRSR